MTPERRTHILAAAEAGALQRPHGHAEAMITRGPDGPHGDAVSTDELAEMHTLLDRAPHDRYYRPSALGMLALYGCDIDEPWPALPHRDPYVGHGLDGVRRSAIIDRTEADIFRIGSAHWEGCMRSAARWEAQARDMLKAGPY